MGQPGRKITEGKTKIIWAIPGTGEVLVQSKDDITAGDGARHDIMPGKAELATRTTTNCFRLLGQAGIPNHFIAPVDERTFRAQRVDMIPIEIVTRRIAYGSYVKRHPELQPGANLGGLVLECFAKDDAKHDPLLAYDFANGLVRRYNAALPAAAEILVDTTPIDESRYGLTQAEFATIGNLALRTFEVLEAAWANQGATLVDLKIECGRTPDGEIVVGDVMDDDSWRLWLGGDPDQMVDKQLYREGRLPLNEIADKYEWVADATDQFVA